MSDKLMICNSRGEWTKGVRVSHKVVALFEERQGCCISPSSNVYTVSSSSLLLVSR